MRLPALALAAFLIAPAAAARDACTAIGLKNDYKRAAVVFLGESNPDGTFRVIEQWKGPKAEVIALDRSTLLRFAPGHPYLVFGYRDKTTGGLYMDDCSHSNPASGDLVSAEITTIRDRHRWWNCPLSSISWRRRPPAPRD